MAARRIFSLGEQKQIVLAVSSLSLANAFYVLRKANRVDEAFQQTARLRKLVRIAAVGEIQVDDALASAFRDCEDALQCSAAESEGGIHSIITRNTKDFAHSP